jgi:hypothetical protein
MAQKSRVVSRHLLFDLLLSFQLLRRRFLKLQHTIQHLGTFGTSRRKLHIGLMLCVLKLMKLIRDV